MVQNIYTKLVSQREQIPKTDQQQVKVVKKLGEGHNKLNSWSRFQIPSIFLGITKAMTHCGTESLSNLLQSWLFMWLNIGMPYL